MGFFAKNTSPGSGTSALLPLTKDRIRSALERAGWMYTVDADGDTWGGWEYASFYFLTNGNDGEVLSVRSSWRGVLEPEQLGQATQICNTWNEEKLWPKTYSRVADDGKVWLHTEHNVDYEQGITDEQLSQQLLCALNTSMAFYESVNEVFPEVWEAHKPEG